MFSTVDNPGGGVRGESERGEEGRERGEGRKDWGGKEGLERREMKEARIV